MSDSASLAPDGKIAQRMRHVFIDLFSVCIVSSFDVWFHSICVTQTCTSQREKERNFFRRSVKRDGKVAQHNSTTEHLSLGAIVSLSLSLFSIYCLFATGKRMSAVWRVPVSAARSCDQHCLQQGVVVHFCVQVVRQICMDTGEHWTKKRQLHDRRVKLLHMNARVSWQQFSA